MGKKLVCSFCSKKQNRNLFITGGTDTTFICQECVGICWDRLFEGGVVIRTSPVHSVTNEDARRSVVEVCVTDLGDPSASVLDLLLHLAKRGAKISLPPDMQEFAQDVVDPPNQAIGELQDPGCAMFDEPDGKETARPRAHSRKKRDPRRLFHQKGPWSGAGDLLSVIIDSGIAGSWLGCTLTLMTLDGVHEQIFVEPRRDVPPGAVAHCPVVQQDNVRELMKDLRTLLNARADIRFDSTVGQFTVKDEVTPGKRGQKRPIWNVYVNLVEKDNPNAPIHLTFTKM